MLSIALLTALSGSPVRLIRSLSMALGRGTQSRSFSRIPTMSIKSVTLALVMAAYFSGFAAADEAVSLERQGNNYIVPVQINGKITLNFMIDTGASDVSITTDVFSTLKRTGTVDDNDLAGTATYKLADGTTHTYQRVILRQVEVGHQIIKNVIATVMDVNADPLLGQAFLSQLPFYIIDNENNSLVIHEDCNNCNPVHYPGTGVVPPPRPRCCEWQNAPSQR